MSRDDDDDDEKKWTQLTDEAPTYSHRFGNTDISFQNKVLKFVGIAHYRSILVAVPGKQWMPY